jgi:hypothetical protein
VSKFSSKVGWRVENELLRNIGSEQRWWKKAELIQDIVLTPVATLAPTSNAN